MYAELNIEKVYHDYEEASYARISKLIDQIDEKVLPKKMFYDFMNRYVLVSPHFEESTSDLCKADTNRFDYLARFIL